MSKARQDLKRNIKDNPYLLSGAIITGIMVLVIIIGIFWTPYDPTAMNSADKLQGMSFRHPMGIKPHQGAVDVKKQGLYHRSAKLLA